MYIFIRFAVVRTKVEVLLRLVLGSKCFSENLESVNYGHLSLGGTEILSLLSIFYNIKLVKDFIYMRVIFKSPIGHLDNLLYIIKKKYKIKEISTEYIEHNDESTVKVISMLRYLNEFFKCVTLNKFF